MKITLIALTVSATMFAGSASAFDPDDPQKLKNTTKCAECDLSHADLYGAFLRRANLQGANLRLADLDGAFLSGADLTDANLRFASMNGVILCNTIMPDGSVIYSGC